jgi:hypothetical protein
MTKIKILGPPLLAKLAAGVALLIIARSLIAWDTATSLSALAVAVPAVWRILRLGVFMDENEVEVRNLITTHRIDRPDARFTRRKSDLRTRTFWGGHVIPPHDAIPKMSDDTMQTETKVMYIADLSDKGNDAHIDAGFGRSPASYETIAARLEELLNPAAESD